MILMVTTSLISCMHYATVKAINKHNEKAALQDFYSPCCGSCGQRIVVEVDGKQYALQVNCQIEDQYSRLCTPLQLGTQKHVLTYKRRKVIREDYYKPVFDTIELKRMYPKIDIGEYYDAEIFQQPVIPLNAVDSLLIDKYYTLTTKPGCSDKHLRLIKGYILVNETYASIIDKKIVKFKVK